MKAMKSLTHSRASRIAPMTRVELLADTNVVSYMFKRGVLGEAYANLMGGRTTGITLQSLAELRAGVTSNNWGHVKVAALDAFVSRFFVVPGTTVIADICGALLGRCEQIGRAMTWPDA